MVKLMGFVFSLLIYRMNCSLRYFFTLCSSRKYPCSPHKGTGISWGMGGFYETKKYLKKCMKLNWNFQIGGEMLEKIPSMGGMDISGTTHNSFFR